MPSRVVAIDGTKVNANAGRDANSGYEQIAREILAHTRSGPLATTPAATAATELIAIALDEVLGHNWIVPTGPALCNGHWPERSPATTTPPAIPPHREQFVWGGVRRR